MIDTEVAGDPASVTAAATWLRDTVADRLGDAADDTQSARNRARGSWEGESASSYLALTHDLLEMTDAHEERIARAATSLDEYAARLRRLESAMRGIRDRAAGGGLVVEGTIIHPPAAAPTGPFEPGSPAEADAQTAVARVELWNTLVTEAADDYRSFTEWVDARMPAKVADAREKDGSVGLFDTMVDLFPNFAAGAGAGLLGNRLLDLSKDYSAQAAEFRRRSRVSGDPRVRGQARTPAGRATLDDLLSRADDLGRFARLAGPAGVLIDVGFGVRDGIETGDWTRASLTTGASIATGLAVTGLVAAGVITAPVSLVVIGGGLAAMGVSYAVGEIYDNWDDITDSVGEAWDSATDTIGDAWDSVTPW